MSFEEMVVSIIAIVGGLSFTGYVFAKIAGLVKSWINRKSSEVPAEDFNRLAKAFMKYKKDTEQRIRHLEAIAAGDNFEVTEGSSLESPKHNGPSQEIRLEEQEPPSQHRQENDSNLRNMLRE